MLHTPALTGLARGAQPLPENCGPECGDMSLMSNTNERSVLTDVTGGIATVTLNKPWKLNAWDTPMRAEIADVLRGWNRDARVRAVVMTGAGDRAFSAGQDLDETEKFQSGNDGANWFESWRGFYNSIRDLDKPCLAALNGVAAGSAFQAAMLTDVRVGHPGVRMGQAEINSGIPSVTGPMLMLPVLLSGATKVFSGEAAGPETSLPDTGSFTSQSR